MSLALRIGIAALAALQWGCTKAPPEPAPAAPEVVPEIPETEEEIWEALKRSPTLALCDTYLERFSDGERAAQVRRLRREIAAREAAAGLGVDAPEVEIQTYLRLHRGTAFAARLQAERAGAAIERARAALDAGDAEAALGWLASARRWEPERDLSDLEAAARREAGRQAAGAFGAGDLDAAIEELERSLELSGEVPGELGDLYVQRARRRFETGDPAGGMRDLAAAEVRTPALTELAAELRSAWARRLLESARQEPERAVAVAEALYLAGEVGREPLEILVWDGLRRGDAGALARLDDLIAGGEPAEWFRGLAERVFSGLDAELRALVEDPARTDALLEPAGLWTAEAAAERERIASTAAVYPAAAEIARGRNVAGAEGPAPRAPASALQDLRRGADPLDSALPLVERAELIAQIAGRLLDAGDLAASDPARLVQPLLDRQSLPADAAEWAWLTAVAARTSAADSYPVALSGGEASLRAAADGGTLRLEIALPGAPERADDAAIGAGLMALFASARPLFFGRPELEQLDVILLSGEGGLELARLGLSRRAVERMHWGLIAAEAPFGPDHLGLVVDHSLRE